MKSTATVLFVVVLLQTLLFSNQIEKSVNVITKSNDKLKSYQKKIDTNEEQREKLLSDYKYYYGSLKNTKRYNEQLEKIIKSQNNELISYDTQIKDIEETKKNIFPYMTDMIISLKSLIEKDTPFLLKERLARVNRLENTINKADIQTHEKYRIILEAFKIEYDYAKNIETYQDKIDNKTYNVLRIGRIGLYYQSLDLQDYGYYNSQTKSWDKVEDGVSKTNIRKAIKIARKQQNVDFLNLPFLVNKDMK